MSDLPSLPPVPPSEGGQPQSQIAPGDSDRELIHEVRNLATAVDLLTNYVGRIETRLEEAQALSEQAEKRAGSAEDKADEVQRQRHKVIFGIAVGTALAITAACFATLATVNICFITNSQHDVARCHIVPGYSHYRKQSKQGQELLKQFLAQQQQIPENQAEIHDLQQRVALLEQELKIMHH